MGFLNNLENRISSEVIITGNMLKSNAFRVREIELKSAHDPVTEFDKKVEEELAQKLIGMGLSVNGEEFGFHDNNDSRYIAHIDPIDGTKSFVFQEFDSSIGIGVEDKVNGNIEIGMVYDFMRNILYKGSRSNGLEKLFDGKEVKFPKRNLLPSKKRVLIEGPLSKKLPLFEHLSKNGYSVNINSGSYLLSMAHTAFGGYDGFIGFGSERYSTNFWDVAGGTPMLKLRESTQEDFNFTHFNGDEYNHRNMKYGLLALDNETRNLIRDYI